MNELIAWVEAQIVECQTKVDDWGDSHDPIELMKATINVGSIVAFNEVKRHLEAGQESEVESE